MRYALEKLQDEGYEINYVNKKIITVNNRRSGFNYDESSSRQFYLLCWLSTYSRRGCEETVVVDRMCTDLGVHQQTVARDLEFLRTEMYIQKDGTIIRVSQRLISHGFLSNFDLDRLTQVVLSFGPRLDNPEIVQSIVYKLLMHRLDLNDHFQTWEKLTGRISFLGGEVVEDDIVAQIVSTIRNAMVNKMWLKTAKGYIQPQQVLLSKLTGVWYLIGRSVPKTRSVKFRVNNLGAVSVIPAQKELLDATTKIYQPESELIELEVYPDFSEQKKILYQLAGLNSVRAYLLENGVLRVTMEGEHREDFIRWLRMFGPSLKVIRSKHLRSQLLHSAENVALQYTDSGR